MEFYIIRHGVTEWNRLKKFQGSTDIPLSEEGIRLAELTGKAMKGISFDLCFTSPLQRAKKTAELVLGEKKSVVPMIEDARIREIDGGILEGVRFKDEDGKILYKEMALFFEDPQNYPRPENGENFQDVCDRTREFWMEKVMDPALQDKRILIASHGCAVRALLQNVYEDSSDFWHGCVPPNCAVNVVRFLDGKAYLAEEDKVYARL